MQSCWRTREIGASHPDSERCEYGQEKTMNGERHPQSACGSPSVHLLGFPMSGMPSFPPELPERHCHLPPRASATDRPNPVTSLGLPRHYRPHHFVFRIAPTAQRTLIAHIVGFARISLIDRMAGIVSIASNRWHGIDRRAVPSPSSAGSNTAQDCSGCPDRPDRRDRSNDPDRLNRRDCPGSPWNTETTPDMLPRLPT